MEKKKSAAAAATSLTALQGPQWRTVVLLPNLIGYARIFASFWALHRFGTTLSSGSAAVGAGLSSGGDSLGSGRFENATSFLVLMLLAACSDMIDGPIARLLGQTSTLGVYVDIVADNVWRTAAWAAVVLVHPGYAWVGLLVISVEWLTFFASQVTALTKAGASKPQQVGPRVARVCETQAFALLFFAVCVARCRALQLPA
jgi:phosphatidylglycerophosphate synthase